MYAYILLFAVNYVTPCGYFTAAIELQCIEVPENLDVKMKL